MNRRLSKSWHRYSAFLFTLGASGISLAASPPGNDRCEDAQAVQVGESVAGTTLDSHWDFNACGAAPYPGVWFKVVGTGTEITATVTDVTAPLRIYVYCGPCDYLGCLASDSGPGILETTWCSTAEREYWIHVGPSSSVDSEFTLAVTANEPACVDPGDCDAPSNDRCIDAEPVSIGEVTLGHTQGARSDVWPPCETWGSYHQDGGFALSYPGVWYRVIGDGAMLRLSPPLGYMVFCNDCSGPVCVPVEWFVDQAMMINGAEWCSQKGAEYLILVNEPSGPDSPFEFTVTSTGQSCPLPHVCIPPPDPPANDACEDAISVAGVGEFPFDNRGGNYTDVPGCIMEYDVWYCWTAPADGNYAVETCGRTAVPTELSVYDGCRCLTGDELACTYGESPGLCGYQSRATFNAVAGQEYLVRLGSSWKAVGGGTGAFHIGPSGPSPARSCAAVAQARPFDVVDPCAPQHRYEAENSTRGRHHVVDDFTLEEDATVPLQNYPSICWYGGYFDGAKECERSASDDFEITIYADDCGVPGDILAGPFSQSGGTLTVEGPTPTGAALMDSSTEYAYSATHAPVQLQAGMTYWIEITNSADGDCEWYWESAGGTDGLSYQDGRGAGLLDGYDPNEAVSSDAALCVTVNRSYSPVCYPPPGNDSCESAAALADMGVFIDTHAATTDGLPVQDPSLSGSETGCDFPLGDEQVNQDVWYDYPAHCTGPVSLSLCGGGFDSKLAIYDDLTCPPDASPIACNDDSCGSDPGLDAALSFHAVRGRDYRLRVGGFRTAVGTATLSLSYSPGKKADLRSFASLAECFTGPCSLDPCGEPLIGLPCCRGLDFDADGDVDGDDYHQLSIVLLGP